MTPEIEVRLRSAVNFPSPPGVAMRIIDLAQDPDIDIGKVAKAVSVDSAMTAKILRMANSPMYAQRRRIENLRQALIVLGLNATVTLALSFTLVKALRSGQPNGLDYPHYWRRSLLAASAARALADALRQTNAEELFLAGLLQDVGMLALDSAMPDLYHGTGQLQRDHAALTAHEMQILQTDHAAVGAKAMRSWNLPAVLCTAIEKSHGGDFNSVAARGDVFDRCVALSGGIADLFLVEPHAPQLADMALAVQRSVGLDKLAFGQVLGTIGAIIPETEALFGTELLSSASREALLDQARDMLMMRSLQVLRDIRPLAGADA